MNEFNKSRSDTELRIMLLENVQNNSITKEWADWFYNEFLRRTHSRKFRGGENEKKNN